jgi:MFS transporter, DHA1 family, inner membrane transport protein
MSQLSEPQSSKMPVAVWVLTLSAFAIGTAEFVIAGILTQVADTLRISYGQAGNLITAYAMAIVIGGPLLTIGLARFERKTVLLGLMALFVIGNIISATTSNYSVLLVSRIITGLTQGPFYGIGAVMAAGLVSEKMAGRAVGQMFAGLTLANVLGVPAGSWIGNWVGTQPFGLLLSWVLQPLQPLQHLFHAFVSKQSLCLSVTSLVLFAAANCG